MGLALATMTLLVSASFQSSPAAQNGAVDRTAALQSQIDRIFRDQEYDPPRFGPARWLPDGTPLAVGRIFRISCISCKLLLLISVVQGIVVTSIHAEENRATK
jgi:hypothetical protein